MFETMKNRIQKVNFKRFHMRVIKKVNTKRIAATETPGSQDGALHNSILLVSLH